MVDDPQDFRIQPCLSPVWDTAITAIALAQSRTAIGAEALDDALKRSVAWLEAREVRVKGDWMIKNGAVEPSGWAFEYRNDFYPDTDDTMMVLMAFQACRDAGEAVAPEQAALHRRALTWLLSFQCRDGGWAAFDKDVTQRWLQDVPFADHNAILDPSCADLTGRVLELLGKLRFAREDIRVRRALTFLRKTQEPDGSWFGRWGVNYIYGTWQVLRGLAAMGEDMRQPWLVRAREWLESCQNEDGGWGETCASYEDAKLKGQGPSTASQTAWAVMGLLAALQPGEHPARKCIRRGVEWLIAHQSSDGSWPEPDTTGTGFPRVFYLRYDMYRNNWPLLALADYRQALARG
jgi:squalene-hopene/tetraprenyl-beta-curcumene cyclase